VAGSAVERRPAADLSFGFLRGGLDPAICLPGTWFDLEVIIVSFLFDVEGAFEELLFLSKIVKRSSGETKLTNDNFR